MSVCSSDIASAINTIWDASDLDDSFKELWSDPTSENYEVFNDGEASPGQLFPYCVFEMGGGATTDRMTADATTNREIRDVPLTFNVHASIATGDDRTAKQIASYLVEEIMKVFGGHPTSQATELTLSHGMALPTQYQTDWGIRTDDDEYQHIVSYLVRVDAPLAV